MKKSLSKSKIKGSLRASTKIGAPPKPAKNKFKGFKLNVRSRHPSHSPLKKTLLRLPFRTVIRLGSSWAGDGKKRIECNSVNAITTSANKLLMKKAFTEAGVKTANWWTIQNNLFHSASPTVSDVQFHNMEYPIVAKHIHGSRGTGNYLLQSQEELTAWLQGKTLTNYIFEKFYDFNREYRLHVTADGCFYACRKMLKSDTPEDKRWFRNDSNSVWVIQYDEQGNLKEDFDQPVNWKDIVSESVKALRAVGLDIGAIDVRVQGATDKKGKKRPAPEFIILETNSAPSFGDITLQKYVAEIPKVLKKKYADNW